MEPHDIDTDGTVRAATVRRWVDEACDDYLARCPRLGAVLAAPGNVTEREVRIAGGVTSDAGDVVVTARATELWPSACRLSVRVRASDAAVLDGSCIVSVRDGASGAAVELGDDVRDELIALEHAAQHFN